MRSNQLDCAVKFITSLGESSEKRVVVGGNINNLNHLKHLNEAAAGHVALAACL